MDAPQTLLIVYHSLTGGTEQLVTAATGGARREAPDVDVRVLTAPQAGPEDVLTALPDGQRLRLPMRPGNRSLNLSNAVAVVVFEAWRQQGFAGASS